MLVAADRSADDQSHRPRLSQPQGIVELEVRATRRSMVVRCTMTPFDRTDVAEQIPPCPCANSPAAWASSWSRFLTAWLWPNGAGDELAIFGVAEGYGGRDVLNIGVTQNTSAPVAVLASRANWCGYLPDVIGTARDLAAPGTTDVLLDLCSCSPTWVGRTLRNSHVAVLGREEPQFRKAAGDPQPLAGAFPDT